MTDKIGFTTLKRQLKEQQDLISELRRIQIPSPVTTDPSKPGPSRNFAESIYTIKSQLAESKSGHAADALDSIFEEYRKNVPQVDESLTDLGELIEYSIDFIEKNANLMMNLLEVFSSDESLFKLNTCILLILMVLPTSANISKDVLESTINTIVKLKNEMKAVISQVHIIPKKKHKKKQSFLAKLLNKHVDDI